ncbi:MAG: FKBP-type peptidyl-prolyl cis-trans isomerase [Burkholderiaceae bacterium]
MLSSRLAWFGMLLLSPLGLAFAAEANANANAMMQKAAAAKGAQVTAAGVVLTPIKSGKGATPTTADWVKVHYTLRHPDGPEIESSRRLGQPAVVDLATAGACFQEGLVKMKVGGRARITCPAATVRGSHGSSIKPTPGLPYEFQVELLGIVKHP